jgi:hypothetical protein
MAIRIWSSPLTGYPKKHFGVYRHATDDRYESLKFYEGEPVDLDHEITFLFEESLLDQLAKLGCLWTNISPPLVNGVIGEVLLAHAAKDVQLFRANVIAKDGVTRDYYLVNFTSLVHCLDFEKSVISGYFDDGSPRWIDRLRFKNEACMNGHDLARLSEDRGYILVSEKLYQALSTLKFKGLQFNLDSDIDL